MLCSQQQVIAAAPNVIDRPGRSPRALIIFDNDVVGDRTILPKDNEVFFFSILGVYGMGSIVYGLLKFEHSPDKSMESLVNNDRECWCYTEMDI